MDAWPPIAFPTALSPARKRGAQLIIEGTILSKETGLSAVFEGVEQPYVRCVIARLDAPEVHAEARVVGLSDVPAPVGGRIKLEVTRTITDRRAGVVRFDCKLLEASGPVGA
jgi:hypothetical protein